MSSIDAYFLNGPLCGAILFLKEPHGVISVNFRLPEILIAFDQDFRPFDPEHDAICHYKLVPPAYPTSAIYSAERK